MQIVGIDEVGRGCWAGPVVAGAVMLAEPLAGLKDSKLLTKAQREKLAVAIHEQALAVGLGWVDAIELDTVGLTAAVGLAMQRALAQISVPFDQVIIDGNYDFLPGEPRAITMVKADATVPAVSAASIVAKVARDAYMRDAANAHPAYGFEKHVGYGTALHAQMLKLHGVTELHRHSFKPVRAFV